MPKPNYIFPDPNDSTQQGLLALGGDLSPECLLQAYSHGIFPWFNPGDPIIWWSPDPRLILIPSAFKVTHSLKKTLNKPFKFTIDTQFKKIMKLCASCDKRKNNTWITKEMISAYTRLHTLGYAHSFEVWLDEQLVGGLYGISLGKAFFGESMFHAVTDASKIALYFLCQVMQAWEYDFIDCQMPTQHLLSLGAIILKRKKYLHLLELALKHPTKMGHWHS